MYKNGFGINNLKLLMRHKTKPNQTKLKIYMWHIQIREVKREKKKAITSCTLFTY